MVKGLYCLEIYNSKLQTIKVGKKYKISFSEGDYFYIGSALNGIDSRVLRHLRNDKKLFWHIDYLLTNKNVIIKKIYYLSINNYEIYRIANSNKYLKKECKVAKSINSLTYPISHFGCSDCSCASHLFFDMRSKIRDIEDLLIKKYGFKNYNF